MNPVGQKNIVAIGPSRSLGLFLCSTHLAALIVVLYFSLLYPLCLVLLLPLLWSWVRGWSMHVALTADSALASVEWGADGTWTLMERQGRQTGAKLLQPSFVAPRLTLLSFSCESGLFHRHVILLEDNASADQVRRLRVRLRMAR